MAFQATSGSQREKWVTALLPAVVILLIGFVYISFFAFPDLTQAEEQFDQASRNVVTPDIVFALKQQAKSLRQQRDQMRDTMTEVEEEVIEKSKMFQSLSSTAKHNVVTRTCRHQGVAILRDQRVESMNLPPLRMESIDALRSVVPEDAISFRELTLAADYRSIVQLLEQLPEIPGVIPISLKLEKTQRDSSIGKPAAGSSATAPVDDSAVSWTVGLLM